MIFSSPKTSFYLFTWFNNHIQCISATNTLISFLRSSHIVRSFGKLSDFLLALFSFSSIPKRRPGRVLWEQHRHHFTISVHTFKFPCKINSNYLWHNGPFSADSYTSYTCFVGFIQSISSYFWYINGLQGTCAGPCDQNTTFNRTELKMFSYTFHGDLDMPNDYSLPKGKCKTGHEWRQDI